MKKLFYSLIITFALLNPFVNTNVVSANSLQHSTNTVDDTVMIQINPDKLLNNIKMLSPETYNLLSRPENHILLRSLQLRHGGTYVVKKNGVWYFYINSALVKLIKFGGAGIVAGLLASAPISAGLSAGLGAFIGNIIGSIDDSHGIWINTNFQWGRQ